MIKYIKDKQKIFCPSCHYSNEVFIPVQRQFISKEGARKCENCGTIIYYDIRIKYKIKSDLERTLGNLFIDNLKEIETEEDICSLNE